MKYSSDIEKMIYVFKAFKHYQSFAKAIKELDVKAIESSVIFQLLEEMLTRDDCGCIEYISPDTVLFRARIVEEYVDEIQKGQLSLSNDKMDILGYDRINSKEPLLRKSGEGRNNLYGVSYLYVAEDEYTACAEVKPKIQDLISLASFKVMKKMKSFNLKDDFCPVGFNSFESENGVSVAALMTNVMKAFSTPPSEVTCEYQVTQFISDLIRKHGFDAISYCSGVSGNKNYTIFNSCNANIQFQNSQLIYLKSVDYSFSYLNTAEDVLFDDMRRIAEKKHIEDMKNAIIQQILKVDDAENG